MTSYPRGSFLVMLKASIVAYERSPVGNPPPTSSRFISWPYSLPIFRQFLPKVTALLKPEDPWYPEPQWKWIPFKLIPSYAISAILSWISWSVSKSSPNFPENGVDKLSLAASLIAILHRILIFGAHCFILWSSSIESAVVSLIPLYYAHRKSVSSFIGLE